MKRFGVRLAGGVGVVILGILAAAQSHKDDSSSTEDLARDMFSQPSPPIAAMEDSPWSTDDTVFRGNDAGAGPAYGGVQLATHEAPIEPTGTDAATEGAIMMPTMPNTEMPAADAGPSLAMPSMSDAGAAGGPAATLSLPESIGAPTMVDTATGDTETMPTLDMNAGMPVMSSPNVDPSVMPDGISTGGPPTAAAAPNMLRSDPMMRSPDASPEITAPATVVAMDPSGTAPGNPATNNLMPDGSGYQFQAAEMRTVPSMPTAQIIDSASGLSDARQPAPLSPYSDPPSMAQAAPSFPPPPAPANVAVITTPPPAPTAAPVPVAPSFPTASPPPAASPSAAAFPIGRIASRDTTSLPAMDNVMGQPGDRRWEGAQAPSVLIHKRAPEEVKVGKPATFVIDVRNVGTTDAYNVQIHDRVPDGMRLVDVTPQPTGTVDALVWSLGGLEPGGERSITMQLIPETEGELGSVARVTFEAAASVRTISTRPQLRIRQRAPERVLIGQQLELEINIENTGTGTASGVVLQADIPAGLEHPKGRQLDNLIGDLGPGETRTQILRLRATGAGMVENIVRLTSDDGAEAQDAVGVEIVAPQLAVELQGPSKRFLERPATYNVAIANTGTANATNVELVAYLDRGFTFVSTENEGQYDPSRHAVYWSLAELPPGSNGLVALTLLPVEEGEQTVRLEVTGDLNVREKSEKLVMIDTLAELTFAVADDQDPVETGSETTYEIRVSNNGSRGDSNVQLQIKLPPELELVSADRNAGTDGRGMVAFEPLPRLTSQQEEVYRVRVRGLRPGTHIIQAILTSDQSAVPVTKEESTTVYSDQ